MVKTRFVYTAAHILLVLGMTACRTWAADLSAAETAGEVAHKQKMDKLFPQLPATAQAAAPIIQKYQLDNDETGSIMTYQSNGFTVTVPNAFFQNLGTNGRTCLTCHQPQNGWALSKDGAED